MSEPDFTPGINDPAKQHFIDASLEELRRLGTGSPDQDFLKTMDKALDQIDAEIKFPTPDSNSKFVLLKNHLVIGAIAALLFIGLFSTVHFSRKIEEPDLALNTETKTEEIENLKNKELLKRADAAARQGSQLLADGDLEGSLESFNNAIDLLPDAPSANQRYQAFTNQYAISATKLARNYADSGRYNEALGLMEDVLRPNIAPNNKGALQLLAQINDPDFFSPALTPQHVARLNKLSMATKTARGFIAYNDYDRAEQEYNKSLNIDNYNHSARTSMDDVERHRMNYYDVARDQTRSTFLRKIAEEWEIPVQASIDATETSGDKTLVGGDFQGEDSDKMDLALVDLAENTTNESKDGLILSDEKRSTPGVKVQEAKTFQESLQSHGAYSSAVNNGGTMRATGAYRRNGRSVLSAIGSSSDIAGSIVNAPLKDQIDASDSKVPTDHTNTVTNTYGDTLSSGLRARNESLIAETDKKGPSNPGFKFRGLKESEKSAKPEAIAFSSTLNPYIGYNGSPDSWAGDGAKSVNQNDVLHGGVSLSVDFGEPAAPVSGPAKMPQILAKKEAAKNQNHPADLAEVPSAPLAPAQKSPAPQNEKYGELIDNAFQSPLSDPLSTFSVDVDTASYSNIRRMVNGNIQIPTDSVRIEEMINYFAYDYPQPEGEHPFAFAVETADCPWNGDHQLMRVGIQGKSMDRDKRPAANLVFLLDVSGSMSPTNKLPLVKQSMGLMIEELTEKDTISVVVYAGAEGLCLPPTSGDQKQKILQSLNNLQSGGSTNGGAGIQLAYKLAKENFKPDGINRVILCTDGDFNVGKTDEGDLTTMVEKKAKDGTFLSVLGFGSGNINDSMLESITNKGNGNYFYIDTLKEGRKVLLQDLMSTLVTIAKDVKIQIEFNPKHVQHYRLIGYANRMLKAEDFENDKIDAGEIGAGHAVTALYEIVPAGAPPIQRKMSNLKYQQPLEPKAPKMKLVESDELCTLKLRYKLPKSDKSTPMELPVTYQSREWKEASNDYQFSAAVALWGMLLREGEHCGKGTVEDVLEMAKEGTGADPFGRRAELIELVNQWNKTAALTGKAEDANDAFHSGVEISVDF